MLDPSLISQENVPFIEFQHNIPMLYGDADLREELNLDEHTRAIMADNVVHEMWTPTLAGIPTEGWQND